MVTQVVRYEWEASDGTIFETEVEARMYELRQGSYQRANK